MRRSSLGRAQQPSKKNPKVPSPHRPRTQIRSLSEPHFFRYKLFLRTLNLPKVKITTLNKMKPSSYFFGIAGLVFLMRLFSQGAEKNNTEVVNAAIGYSVIMVVLLSGGVISLFLQNRNSKK